MGLADIADGLEVTETQTRRGVATIDDTGATVEDRLAPFEDELPCSATESATALERYSAGGSVGAAARTADVAPVTAAKVLHLLGESVSPATPLQREIIHDWMAGELSRHDARSLTQLDETEFALATFVETHDPLEAACAEIEGVLAAHRLEDGDPLADAIGDGPDAPL